MNAIKAMLVPMGITTFSLLGGCASVPEAGGPENLLAIEPVASDVIRWPGRYRPEDATFFVHNQIEIAAPPERVWAVLIQAETWPSWYEGASNVKVADSATGELAAGSVFTWRTMDLDFTSTVKEFEPPYRLSWESRKSTIQGYHAWLLVPTERGTRLITDESQHGLLAWLQGIFIPNKLRRLHDVWLEGIRSRAEGG